MRYTTLNTPNASFTLSRIALGTGTFGSAIAPETAFAMLDAYAAAGGNVIDTARAYADWLPGGHSASERTIGAWLKARQNRDDMIIVTKGAHPAWADFSPRCSPKELRSDLTESLAALDVAQIDLYLLHRDDEQRAVGEIIEVLNDFVREGKIKAFGVSNWRITRIQEANAYAQAHGLLPIAISEIQWSFLQCNTAMFSDDTLVCMNQAEYDAYQALGMPLLAYSAQAKGGLPKWLAAGAEHLPPHLQCLRTAENETRVANIAQLAQQTGRSPTTLSLQYITQNPLAGIAIIGCSSLVQLTESLSEIDKALAPDALAALLRMGTSTSR